MSVIDIDALLLEIDPAAPCGPNLEYDPVFVALEQESLGKPEVQYGDTITPAVPPDWKVVRRMATELLERSRDLRLAVHLLRANLALSGMPGFADSIALIERLLEERWDSIHPQLDPDDDLDPTLRINSLAILADTGTLLRELKDATLVVLPGLGPLSIKMLEVANGEVPPAAGQEKLAIGSIERAAADVAPEQMAAAVDALARALAATVNIEVILVRQVGSSQALNLDSLTRPLRKGHEFLVRSQQGGDAGGGGEAAEGEPAGADGGARAARTAISGDIASRDDVVRMLDKLVQYYSRHEPSSPIPILLERAKRLVPMNFFEIMEDLAPEGMAQLAVIRGPDGSAPADEY
ncbi:type VI secretion system protein TssA [Massilia sp. PAMC28688]|uniref:type VI secretion system protein TssA n=1 Tax=Massilia sp. PAMC28688 TaxID=2861283 RepID=UPI001C627154|nr:type VI secretion system protein TssA [Massilia sp. PAMC28688]QYF95722.1 type VI secretion system protein TssA [Massilia sp. PAMC28688]